MYGNHHNRNGFLICAFIFILMFAGKSFAQSSSNDDIHIPMEAEFYYLRVYQSLEDHKALAVGPGGNWASSKGAPSSKTAEEAALSSCHEALRTSPYKDLSTRHCVLFDVDGRVTGQAPPIGIPFGTILEGPDYPLGSGQILKPSSQHRRGIMLMLHGCNRVKMGGWWIAWINFYRSAGFIVILPDSFAEPRDEGACGLLPGETGIDKQTQNLKLRIAQARRTLKILREKFPDAPIYLHGHSEGGVVAQALGENVAGIIVTGASCGVGNSEAYWTAPDVPVLVIAGTRDKFVLGGSNPEELTAYCKKVVGPGKLTAVSIQGMGHLAAVWWPEVSEAIAKLLKTAAVKISRRPADDMPQLRVDQIPGYQKAKSYKALATDENGNWYWEDSLETPFDAEESALFGCDDSIGKDPFSNSLRMHSCVLVDVNDRRLVK